MRVPFSIAILAALVAPVAWAAGFGTIHARSKAGHEIAVEEMDWLNGGRLERHYLVAVRKAKRQHFFAQACTIGVREPSGEMYEFSCSSNGKSPLAGATYKVKPYGADCVAYIYTCKTGCKGSAPARLYQSFWECPDEP